MTEVMGDKHKLSVRIIFLGNDIRICPKGTRHCEEPVRDYKNLRFPTKQSPRYEKLL